MTQSSPPKILLAIVNARHRGDWRNTIRRTWLPQVPKDRANAFFFVGKGEAIADGENVIELNCSDAYKDLPSKVQTITRWALANDYDYMLKIDDDVVLRPEAFLDSGFEKHDFSGGVNRPGACPVTFGFCYIISKRSMQSVSRAPLPFDFDDERWVAHMLYKHGIPLVNVDGYSLHQTVGSDPTVKIARCVHLDSKCSQAQKLGEFERIFSSPQWTGDLVAAQPSTVNLHQGRYIYDKAGLVTNWWDRHSR